MGIIEGWTNLREKINELGDQFAANQPQLGWWRDILLPIADNLLTVTIDSYRSAVAVSRHSRSESRINKNNKHRQYIDQDRVGER